MEPDIRFCTTSDGVRIAYATVGQGPPVVRVLGWLTHLELDWEALREYEKEDMTTGHRELACTAGVCEI